MKKLLYILLLGGIGFLGFTMGRATGVRPVQEIPQANQNYPLPPPPPESTPFIPGMPEDDGEPEQGIVIETPVEGAKILGAFSVTGRARADAEGQLMISVKAAEGGILYRQPVELKLDAGAQYGRYDAALGPFEDAEGDAIVEVFFMDVDGMESEKQVKNVTFSDPDTVDVQIYFQNSELDPSVSCEAVFPVTRTVSSRTQIYRATIEALLEGPSDDEEDEGFNTSIPSRVRLKSVAADADGVVTADFDSTLDRRVAGSCRVIAIREQIKATLLQFPEVREVVISVEGEVDTALQP